ncbi:acyltransferase family protein [Pyruvatibacter mobilis]|uniref:acyltransferase family protein n=1 Tax=Pyruvatibacter mobilis TaxID=1712261 RepID=UPI003C7BAA30
MIRYHLLADVSDGRDNNLNLMRMLAAAAVALSHSYLLVTGDGDARPLVGATGFSLGYHAVNVFFVISGFLVARSWQRSENLTQFWVARALRIFPALAVCVALTALVAAPLLISIPLGAYFTSWQTFLYLPLTASLITPDATLPGLFASNPVPDEVNGSLWTLRYELICYAGLSAIGFWGVLNNRATLLWLSAILAVPLIILSLLPGTYEETNITQHFVRFGLCFGLGILAYEFRERIPLHWTGVVASLLLAAALHETPLFPISLYVFVAYASFWFAFVPGGAIRKYNALGDASYGLYIYAFPVQQTLVAQVADLNPLELFVLTISIAVPMAAISWVIIEKPALGQRKSVYGFIQQSKERWAR